MFGDTSETGSRIRIKICGITNAADALAAINYGADALGFNFYPRSKRYIDIETAREWIEKLPLGICRVAVLVDPTWAEACRISELPFIDALQLHGNESPQFCQSLAETGIQFAKALPATDPRSLADLSSFSTDTFVLDSAFRGEFGGSGKTFPWHLARGFTQSHPTFRVILAGGLTPENVAAAVSEVRPFGVDVTTGVELLPGRKNHALLRAFIEAARDRGTG
jgi:phosphoribosylanthranilate isomerase